MSNLSLLLMTNPRGTNPASEESDRQAFAPMAWPEAGRTAQRGSYTDQPEEYTLPSGVASMEHWLDLNA